MRPGFGFLRDGPSLGMLREMMVMIRIWGLLKPGCLPIYTATSDNQDSMSLLFRLLTKLWLCCESALKTPSVEVVFFFLFVFFKALISIVHRKPTFTVLLTFYLTSVIRVT